MTSRHRPFALPEGSYPFRDHWLEPDRPDPAGGAPYAGRGGTLHYVDEGDGVPVLFLHGNPTWSFLYRDVIRRLEGQCRCIAPDYPGFGLSSPPDGYRFTPEEHARWIRALVTELALDRFIVVAHDWGGPIGLATATEWPERTAGVVLTNSWCWPPDAWMGLFSLVMGGPAGRWLHLRRNFFARRIVPLGIHRRDRKPPEVLEAYRAPFPTPGSRVGTWAFPRAIRTSAPWLAAVEGRLGTLEDRPVELVWGMRDPALGREKYVARWLGHFPRASVDRVADAAHYLPEDRPDRLADAVRRVLARVASDASAVGR